MDWENRNTVDKNRVDELVELYESLGYEVRIERNKGQLAKDMDCDPDDDCDACELKKECFAHGEYYTVYTRKKKTSKSNKEELI